MKSIQRTALVAAGLLIWITGCQRQSPSETTSSTNPGSALLPKLQSTTPAVANPTMTNAGAEMILLPAGRFLMGDKDEVDATPHTVSVNAFYIDKYLVTQKHYRQVMDDNPSRWKGGNNPVEQVRWSDAVRFCNRRSAGEGLQPCYDLKTWTCNFAANGYRLPTEAEWEYACRAGTKTAYFFGDTPSKLSRHAWFNQNAGGHPRPVGQKSPNPWGLYDMSGNLWEWCNDFYQVDYYAQSPSDNPRGPAEGLNKVVRGGGWRFSAENCRSGYRYNENPGYVDVCFGYDIYGFRCVRNASVSTGP